MTLEPGFTVAWFFSTKHNSLQRTETNETALFCMDNRLREMAFFFAFANVGKGGAKVGRLSRYVEISWNKKVCSLFYKTDRFHVACVCSAIDHRRRQNVVRTSVTHSATPRVPLCCSYLILTSSGIYYWTDTRQHEIYLFITFWRVSASSCNLSCRLVREGPSVPFENITEDNRLEPS